MTEVIGVQQSLESDLPIKTLSQFAYLYHRKQVLVNYITLKMDNVNNDWRTSAVRQNVVDRM